MADTKISGLTALTGANTASGDLLTIVDVSDTTMAATGTNKKITLTELQSAPVSAGTANGVLYLNGSKVATAGTALTFDGTNLGIGLSTLDAKLNVNGYSGNGTLRIGGGTTGESVLYFADSGSGVGSYAGFLQYLHSSDNLVFGAASAERMRLDSSGRLGIGATSLTEYLTVKSPNASTFFSLQTATDSGVYMGNNAGALTLLTASTERARIDSSGNFLVGTTSTNPTNGFVANQNGGNGFYLQIGHPTGTGTGVAYTRYMYNQTEIGSVAQSGTTAVLYNTTSDQRLKENIVDAPEFGGVIDSIKVRSYDWKSDGSHQRAGFVAQELVTVAPEAVHQPTDPEEMMAVDYSKLVPMLVKEIQSLRARVAQLESN